MEYQNESPNFSIVLPGGCNAVCRFCFWKWDGGWPVSFDAKLALANANLSRQLFRTLSLTGGEPTLSPVLDLTLEWVQRTRNRWDRVVLTTNGFALERKTPVLDGAVTHVNISRHAVSDELNRKVFGTSSVPSRNELPRIVDKLNRIGIPVTMSKVLSPNEPKENVLKYIRFAKKIGATSVFLRKQHGDLDAHPAEEAFSAYKRTVSGCPVCLSVSQIIEGMPVAWKRGLLEPAEVGMHEVIMQPSGALTIDWAGKIPYAGQSTENVVTQGKMRALPLIARRTSGGCDHARSGGC